MMSCQLYHGSKARIRTLLDRWTIDNFYKKSIKSIANSKTKFCKEISLFFFSKFQQDNIQISFLVILIGISSISMIIEKIRKGKTLWYLWAQNSETKILGYNYRVTEYGNYLYFCLSFQLNSIMFPSIPDHCYSLTTYTTSEISFKAKVEKNHKFTSFENKR